MSVLDRLYSNDLQAALLQKDGTWSSAFDLSKSIVLAGSFNPLHDGHLRLVKVAEELSGRSGLFEISIDNVDKPDLPRAELERRLDQFKGAENVIVTRARLFSDKAALLAGAWFVVGFDTAVRLLDDRYHADGDAVSDMRLLMAARVKFLVAGRSDSDGEFMGLDNLNVPAGLAEMFISIPESAFRENISSTELREQQSR